MLASLSIRNVVLIDHLELEFGGGLSTVTGETGAGKSILLDALGLALGARSDGRLVRSGAPQAAVIASFRLDADHPVHGLIAERAITPDDDGGVVLRRVVNEDGRSRAFVNDQPVSRGVLRDFAETLVEMHGQFDNQRLMDPAVQRDLLDAHGGLATERAAVAEACRAWRRAVVDLAECERQLATARADEDYLRHVVDELAALAPKPGEEERLAEQRALLAASAKIAAALEQAAQDLGTGGRGPADGLRSAIRALERVAAQAGGHLDAAIGALDRALTECVEGQALLDQAIGELDLDPRRLEAVEERLFRLRAVARKHGVVVDELATVATGLAERLASIDSGEDAARELRAAVADRRRIFADAVARLSAGRQLAAQSLEAAVMAELPPLKLGAARFFVRLLALDDENWNEAGGERILFEVATNPGAAPGPLADVASGGELARLMLAVKVVLAQADRIPTLIFDEVDAGIGGAVADAVGERLARLADDVQVLVLTHSPQVAARGRRHWRVSKSVVDESSTRTVVEPLDDADRREEIARMLAGSSITDEARAAADRLLIGGRP